MPQIASGHGIKIYMYFEDHPPPHFHAFYASFEAVFEIATQRLIKGSVPVTELARIKRWGAINKTGLMTNWRNSQIGLPLNKLPAL